MVIVCAPWREILLFYIKNMPWVFIGQWVLSFCFVLDPGSV